MSLELRFIILTFRSTQAVLDAESQLGMLGFTSEFIAVPGEIDSSCGFCLRLPAAASLREDGTFQAALQGVEKEAMWRLFEGSSWRERRYERIDQAD